MLESTWTTLIAVGTSGFALGALLTGKLDSFTFGQLKVQVRDSGIYFTEDCTHAFTRFRRRAKKKLVNGLIMNMTDLYLEHFKNTLLDRGCNMNDSVVKLEYGTYGLALKLAMSQVSVPYILESLFENGFDEPNTQEFKDDILDRLDNTFGMAKKCINDLWYSTILDRNDYLKHELKDPKLLGNIAKEVLVYFQDMVEFRNEIFAGILKRYPKKTEEDISIEWKLLFD